MSATKTIQFSVNKSIATIKFMRPEVHNSFNNELIQSFQKLLDRCRDDNSIRTVVITGSEKSFSAGQDLYEVIKEKDIDFKKIVQENYNPLIIKIREMNKPVIAAVNGVAAGAGANLAFACDIIVAKESASFIQAFSKIGLIPDCGGTYFLPRLIGFQRASALMLLADKITAPQAKEMGMIYEYFEGEVFEERVMEIANKLANLPTKGLAYTKQLLNQTFKNSIEKQLEQESLWQTQAGNTYDFKEGVAAFLEKRKPIFKGK